MARAPDSLRPTWGPFVRTCRSLGAVTLHCQVALKAGSSKQGMKARASVASHCVARQVPYTVTRCVPRCVERQIAFEQCYYVPQTVCPTNGCLDGGCAPATTAPGTPVPGAPMPHDTNRPAPTQPEAAVVDERIWPGHDDGLSF